MYINLETVIAIRSARKKTQDAMAELLGINRASYRNKETGKTEFTASELGTMAKELSVSPSKFYEEL